MRIVITIATFWAFSLYLPGLAAAAPPKPAPVDPLLFNLDRLGDREFRAADVDNDGSLDVGEFQKIEKSAVDSASVFGRKYTALAQYLSIDQPEIIAPPVSREQFARQYRAFGKLAAQRVLGVDPATLARKEAELKARIEAQAAAGAARPLMALDVDQADPARERQSRDAEERRRAERERRDEERERERERDRERDQNRSRSTGSSRPATVTRSVPSSRPTNTPRGTNPFPVGGMRK